jgi:uncharacterized protein YdeI (YjbR/CyaY-like superfamily)
VPTELEELVVEDAPALRSWLESAPTTGVWLRLARKGTTSPTRLTWDEAVDEALCFGWIDGQTASRDKATYAIRFTPRRPRSIWSRRNVDRVARLADEGRMRPGGLAEVERAKADGRWEAAYAGSADMEMDAGLAALLEGSPRASAMFGILTRQNRYAILFRLGNARQESTREGLRAQFVEMLARGETVHPQRRTLPDPPA